MPRLVLKIARWNLIVTSSFVNNLIVTCARIFKRKIMLCAQMSRVLWHIPLGIAVYVQIKHFVKCLYVSLLQNHSKALVRLRCPSSDPFSQ